VLASNAVPRVASAAALLALVFAASGSAHVTAGPGSGAFIGGNGDILFMSIRVRNGPEQPYLMRPDGLVSGGSPVTARATAVPPGRRTGGGSPSLGISANPGSGR
jgi:hypothetical protein